MCSSNTNSGNLQQYQQFMQGKRRRKRNLGHYANQLSAIFQYTLNPDRWGALDSSVSIGKEYKQKSIKKLNMTRAYEKIFELMWYRKMPCFDVNATTSTYNNQMGILKYCAWKGIKVPCSSIFTPFPTDSGICCTFNMKAADEIFRKSRYTDIVSKLTKRDKSKSFEDTKKPSWFEQEQGLKSSAGKSADNKHTVKPP